MVKTSLNDTALDVTPAVASYPYMSAKYCSLSNILLKDTIF